MRKINQNEEKLLRVLQEIPVSSRASGLVLNLNVLPDLAKTPLIANFKLFDAVVGQCFMLIIRIYYICRFANIRVMCPETVTCIEVEKTG
jgi:hypothetical protein